MSGTTVRAERRRQRRARRAARRAAVRVLRTDQELLLLITLRRVGSRL